MPTSTITSKNQTTIPKEVCQALHLQPGDKLDFVINEEKDVVSRAAALMGVTMAAFVRTAAKEKARELLDRESRVTMAVQDFQAFTMALNGAFTPNAALQKAMNAAREIKRV